MIHLIKLMRPTNLLIIAGTMYGIGWYLDNVFLLDARYGAVATFDFFLLVFSTVIIAGAGNIINDYFDIKADRINRPDRIIIARYIKPRTAILSHWIINFIAFTIAVYLSYSHDTFWYVFIHLLSINLLWGYSVLLKRTLYFGNIVIAFLTGLVPVLVGIYYKQVLNFDDLLLMPVGNEAVELFPFTSRHPENFSLIIGFGLGAFAFMLNWAREIVKDMEDVQGDKKLKAKTIPIRFGYLRSKQITFALLIVTMLTGVGFLFLSPSIKSTWNAFTPVILSAICWIFSSIILWKSHKPHEFRKAHKLIKWIMVFGLLLPLYWSILILLK